jgi:hypothetical protein
MLLPMGKETQLPMGVGMRFWTAKKPKFFYTCLIILSIPAAVYAASWWSYSNITNLVSTDEFIVGSSTRGAPVVNVLWSDILSQIDADGGFYVSGDLLRTENGNSPTAPSNDGEFVVDTDDEQFIIRVGGNNKTFDFSGDSAGYVFGSDGSGGFTLQAAGAGDMTAVLGDATGAVPVLFQSWVAFSNSDATPDVSTATNFRTVDTTTITDFDGTPVDGQFLYVYCGAATVFDLTDSGLSAWNRTTDLTCTIGQIVSWKYRSSTGDWSCENCPDETTTLSSDGIVVNDGGVAEAVSMADNDGITWANADGTDGDPTPTVAYPVFEERTIIDPTASDDYYWFKADGATTVTSIDCIAQGSTPSVTVDVQECNTAGASCTTILDSAITCTDTASAGTISDATLADNAWIYVSLGTPSGTVNAVNFTLAGTK